jgi:S-adenosylmethionine/arginine decarboxylase-like enzyme
MHQTPHSWGQHFILDLAGYTLLQLIETSNISAHFAENLGQAYIDIFSCRAFDNRDAENVCREYFAPGTVVARRLQRGSFAVPLAEAG